MAVITERDKNRMLTPKMLIMHCDTCSGLNCHILTFDLYCLNVVRTNMKTMVVSSANNNTLPNIININNKQQEF